MKQTFTIDGKEPQMKKNIEEFLIKVSRSACLEQYNYMLGPKCICFSCEAKRLLPTEPGGTK